MTACHTQFFKIGKRQAERQVQLQNGIGLQLFDTCLLDILHRAVKDGVVKAALDNINAGQSICTTGWIPIRARSQSRSYKATGLM